MPENIRKLIPAPVLIMLVLVSLASAVALLREFAPDETEQAREIDIPGLARLWLHSVAGENPDRALQAAAGITPDVRPKIPDPDYIQVFGECGIPPAVLNVPADFEDYRQWRSAYIIAKLAAEIPDAESACRFVFKTISFDPAPERKSGNDALSPLDILERGKGTHTELLWLYAEIMRQKGIKAFPVLFFNDDGRFMYGICEVRGGRGIEATADPLTGAYYPGLGAGAWIRKADSMEHLPELIRRGEGNWYYGCAAVLADYRRRNSVLNERLRETLGKKSPAFGRSPRKRILDFLETFPATDRPQNITYWRFPLEKSFPRALVNGQKLKKRTGDD